jgi:hypothetical protein
MVAIYVPFLTISWVVVHPRTNEQPFTCSSVIVGGMDNSGRAGMTSTNAGAGYAMHSAQTAELQSFDHALTHHTVLSFGTSA